MDGVREVFLEEIEWWDRVAIAVELLEKKFGTKKQFVQLGKRTVEWTGNYPPPAPILKESREADAAVYVFRDISDVEILRRLSQMPDETELDLLVRPFVFYCPEIFSLVSVNVPEPPLAEMVEKLFNK